MLEKRYDVLIFCLVIVGAFLLAVCSLFVVPFVVALTPSGATVSSGTSSTAPEDSAGNASAYAGNVTELTISGFSTTQAWQGYFGNITGVIQLADSSDNVMYNWSLASPQGEVMASVNSSITWTNIQCFNFTADGSNVGSTVGETLGGVNLGGTNLSVLEAEFGVQWDDVDGVNETFTDVGSANHDQFVIASLLFSVDECQHTTRIYGDTGIGVDSEFEEVLMYESSTSSVVFTSIIEEDLGGFDSATHDFEMLVLENGNGTDVATTTYYFWLELE